MEKKTSIDRICDNLEKIMSQPPPDNEEDIHPWDYE